MTDTLPFATFRPADLTPTDRAAAVAVLLTAGLLCHLHPAVFPPDGATNSQEKPGELT